jgi:hypothetical protein
MILNKNNKVNIYILCILSLVISSILGENSSGGSKLDYSITRQYVDNFLLNFNEGINYFIKDGQDQSPVFYILNSYIEKNLGIKFFKYFYILISSFIPLIFYILLKKKFKSLDKNYLYLISLIIFFSPYFRSSSSWMTTDNLAILFFILSLNKFLSLEKKKTFVDLILCSIYLGIATYVRQYYGIFFILYLILIYKKLTIKEILILTFLIIIIFIPAIYYYFIFFEYNKSYEENFIYLININYLYTYLIFSSFYFFYLLPFYLYSDEIQKISKNLLNKKKIIYLYIISLVFIFICFFDPIDSRDSGGGLFIKLSEMFKSNLIIYIASYIGSLGLLININKNNFFIYMTLILMFPFFIIYQKYYDPLLLISIFALTKNDHFEQKLLEYRVNLKSVYIYYILFLFTANLYYF